MRGLSGEPEKWQETVTGGFFLKIQNKVHLLNLRQKEKDGKSE